MSDHEIQFWVMVFTAAGVFLASGAYLLGAASSRRKEIASQFDSLRLELSSLIDKLGAKESLDVGALRAEAEARSESLERELTGMVRDQGSNLQAQIDSLRKEGATKPELKAVEDRIMAAVTEFKTETRTAMSDISKKVERLPVMEIQIGSVVSTLEKVITLIQTPGILVPLIQRPSQNGD